MLASLSAQLGVTRGGVSVKSLTPNFKRLKPALEAARTAAPETSRRSCRRWCCCRCFASAVYGIVQDNWSTLLKMPLQEAETARPQMASPCSLCCGRRHAVRLIPAPSICGGRTARYTRDLRMSKQDLREESKEMEGNPQIRGRLRQLRREWLRRRMMSQVPKAHRRGGQPDALCGGQPLCHGLDGPLRCGRQGPQLRGPAHPAAASITRSRDREPPAAQALYKTAKWQEIPAAPVPRGGRRLAYIYRIMGTVLPG